MKPGDRVLVVAPDSRLRGKQGVVRATVPRLLVVLDDDGRALAFGEREVIPAEESARHVGGAE